MNAPVGEKLQFIAGSKMGARKGIVMIFCDTVFAGDLVTRRSESSILIFINGAPVTWYSKRQNTAVASAFDSEFITLRVGYKINDGLRYKLGMMGVPIRDPPIYIVTTKL